MQVKDFHLGGAEKKLASSRVPQMHTKQSTCINYVREHCIDRNSMTPLTLGLMRREETKFQRILHGCGGIAISNQKKNIN